MATGRRINGRDGFIGYVRRRLWGCHPALGRAACSRGIAGAAASGGGAGPGPASRGIARRIVTYSREGKPAAQGAEFGFIKFGSRVDVFLPKGARIAVRIGDRVQGSTSVIARFEP